MTRAVLVDADSFSYGHILPEMKEAIRKEGLKIISASGTKFGDELKGADKKWYAELKRSARILELCQSSVAKKIVQLELLIANQAIESDDAKALAGAIISRANTIVTKDEKLKRDFKKVRLVDRKTVCCHRIDLNPCKSQKVITPSHGPFSKKGTKSKDIKRLLNAAECSSVSCNCVNGGPSC